MKALARLGKAAKKCSRRDIATLVGAGDPGSLVRLSFSRFLSPTVLSHIFLFSPSFSFHFFKIINLIFCNFMH
jgi:hypothetical protein